MGEKAILAVLGFALVNILNHTRFALSEMQSGVLMLLSFLALVKYLEEYFRPVRKRHARDCASGHLDVHPSVTNDIPAWGTAEHYVGNPDMHRPETGRYGD